MLRASMSLVRSVRRSALPRAAPLRALSGVGGGGGSLVSSEKKRVGGAKKDDLASVLAKEIAYEAEEGSSESAIAGLAAALKTASGFELTDTRGGARFSLVRKVGGQEVRLDVDCTPVPTEDDPEYYDDEEGKEGGGGGDKAGGAGGEDDEEEDGAGEGYRVLISVADGAKGQVLQVGAFVTDALRIQRVTLHKAGAQPSADEVFSGSEANSAYGGPVFDELDETLQNAFYEYLAQRGVDDELAGRIADYCSSKEQLEYVSFLQGVEKFVSK